MFLLPLRTRHGPQITAGAKAAWDLGDSFSNRDAETTLNEDGKSHANYTDLTLTLLERCLLKRQLVSDVAYLTILHV